MSELEKAKQEVEQVCFAYDKAGDTGDIKDWKKYYDLENKLIDKVKIANQPQLTIPQSIADALDKISNYPSWVYSGVKKVFPKEIMQWCENSNQGNEISLCIAYLAGKALGVDLVKVVADEN